MSEVIKLPATLTGIRSRVDRSYVLSFNTQELSPQEAADLSLVLQTFGLLGFAVNEKEFEKLDTLEAPEEIVDRDEKSKSTRLRNVLYRWWEYEGRERYPIFDEFYKVKMEGIIDQIKRKLPEQA